MRIYFKKILYLVVITGLNWAHAGSYEDFFIAIKRDDRSRRHRAAEPGF
jgi:hypothetical protein